MVHDWLAERPATPHAARARLDVSERDDRYEVRAELPGASRDAIAVDIDGARVSISASAKPATEQKEGEKLLYSERRSAAFERAFELPQAVNADAAQARFEDGVLTLTLPKMDALKARRLTVQ
ncbi:MAG: hypothetical protein AD742_17905 [Methylibium sp. NZG]|nr:MAG: hypothetical protein AD742_17905 [Methylibium sp. NZG]